MTPESLGFQRLEPGSWTKPARSGLTTFRLLTEIPDLVPLEQLQREVMGVRSDLDIYAGNELLILPETGGHVLAAYLDGELAGAVFGFGGFVDRTPRIVSDWMGVWPRFRSAGLGAELKKLQAAIAFGLGFQEIVWTVDPLRAANARLNIEKLGATSNHYERNRYGSDYAPGLYGGLPTDRLHMTWNITDPAIHHRLYGQVPTLTAEAITNLAPYALDSRSQCAIIAIPTDIDAIVKTTPSLALDWRMRLREQIESAFNADYAITGFAPSNPHEADTAAFILTRTGATLND